MAKSPAVPPHAPAAPLEHEAERSSHTRDDGVPSRAADEDKQAQEALNQMGAKSKRLINEGGRTNDSRVRENPEGAVGAIPTPAIRGTYR